MHILHQPLVIELEFLELKYKQRICNIVLSLKYWKYKTSTLGKADI